MNRSVRFPSGFCFFYISFILQNSSSEMNTKVIFKENRNQNGSLFIFPLLFHSRTEILFDLPFGLFCILELFWNLEFSESGNIWAGIWFVYPIWFSKIPVQKQNTKNILN